MTEPSADMLRSGLAPATKPRLFASPAVRASSLSWLFLVSGLVAGWLGAPPLAPVLLYAAAIACGGFFFAREALEELVREREVGIELLMSAAIAGAAALGNWREGALVAALYSISEALEHFTIDRTRFAIRSLMDLVPPRARLLRDGVEIEVPVEEVPAGGRIVIRPGESIPVDGVIREGASAVNESAVTGESLPVERVVGDTVFAGSLNGNGALVVEASRTFADNTINKIIHLVESAQAQKGRSQLFIEKFGRIYSPAVLGTAILLAIVPWLAGLDAAYWAKLAISFLVAASPCALAVATPVTLVAAIGSAAKHGVLVKGGSVLETLGRVRAVALDKTGTLTHGKPVVTAVHGSSAREEEVLALAAAVEHFSEHPLASAIVAAAAERGAARLPASDFRALTAAGVEASVAGGRVAVLKPAAVRERGIELGDKLDRVRTAAEAGGETTVVVLRDSKPVGILCIADTTRPEARTLVSSLGAHIKTVVMLTGDNRGTAESIAAEVGIRELHAGLLPEEKVAKVRELRERSGVVAMVGDGINDAPALAAANVGIAMGTGGSDAALAAADVALVSDDLSKLGYAFDLGRRSRRVILENIVMSVAVVVALVLGTFFADLGMFGAVLGHEGSEVLIILNGLRVAIGGNRALRVPANAKQSTEPDAGGKK